VLSWPLRISWAGYYLGEKRRKNFLIILQNYTAVSKFYIFDNHSPWRPPWAAAVWGSNRRGPWRFGNRRGLRRLQYPHGGRKPPCNRRGPRRNKKCCSLWRATFVIDYRKFVIKQHLWRNLRRSCIERHRSLLVTSLSFRHRLTWFMTLWSRHRIV
jgi:hypothetical protein